MKRMLTLDRPGNPQQAVRDAQHAGSLASRLGLTSLCCCWCALTMFLGGCGGSDSSSSVVPPPSPSVIEASPADVDPPGGIELPPGEIPPPESVDPKQTEGGIQMPEGAKVPVDSGAANQPNVRYGTWDEIQQAARSSGRITVLDLWSLACEPCLKEFPGLVQLHRSHGDKIQCIAVDLDYDGRSRRPPQHYQEQVVSFLASVNASGFPAYISSTPNEDVYAATGLVSIPAVLIYNAEGELVKTFVDAGETAGFSYQEDVIPFVTRLAT